MEEAITKRSRSKEEMEKIGAKEVICYKCKKLGHVKYDCPLYKAKREKRKAMMTTWSKSEDSSDDENEKEVVNICFKAFEVQDEVNFNFDDDDDFMIEYEELLKYINKLDEKNASLKKKVFELKK